MSIYLPSVTKYAGLKAVLLELNHSEKKKGNKRIWKTLLSSKRSDSCLNTSAIGGTKYMVLQNAL